MYILYVSVLYIPTAYIQHACSARGIDLVIIITNPPRAHVLSPWPVLGCIIYYWCVITHPLQLAFYNVHRRNIFGCIVCIDISRHTQFNTYTWTSATCTSVTEQSMCAKLIQYIKSPLGRKLWSWIALLQAQMPALRQSLPGELSEHLSLLCTIPAVTVAAYAVRCGL